MVAAEAAAAGVLPVVSAHSGLAEVAAGIGEEVGQDWAALLSFPAGDAAALRDRLAALLALPAARRRELASPPGAQSSAAGAGAWSPAPTRVRRLRGERARDLRPRLPEGARPADDPRHASKT